MFRAARIEQRSNEGMRPRTEPRTRRTMRTNLAGMPGRFVFAYGAFFAVIISTGMRTAIASPCPGSQPLTPVQQRLFIRQTSFVVLTSRSSAALLRLKSFRRHLEVDPRHLSLAREHLWASRLALIVVRRRLQAARQRLPVPHRRLSITHSNLSRPRRRLTVPHRRLRVERPRLPVRQTYRGAPRHRR